MDIKNFLKRFFYMILKLIIYFVYIFLFFVIISCIKEIFNNLNYGVIESIFLSYKELIVVLLASYFTFRGLKYTLMDLLDSKSEWRKKIYDLASKSNYTMDDIFRLRASLRFTNKKRNILSIDSWIFVYSEYIKYKNESLIVGFDDFSDSCIMYIDKKIDEYYHEKNIVDIKELDIKKIITDGDEQLIRVICMVILKNHWEFNSSLSFFNLLVDKNKDTHNLKPQPVIYEALNEIAKINIKYNKKLLCLFYLNVYNLIKNNNTR